MKSKFLAASLAFVLTAGIAAAAQTLKGAELSKYAVVSLQTARATALKTVHGTIVDQELEREAGGSGLRYSFDVKIGKTVREVGIDAKTGKVLENSVAGND